MIDINTAMLVSITRLCVSTKSLPSSKYILICHFRKSRLLHKQLVENKNLKFWDSSH